MTKRQTKFGRRDVNDAGANRRKWPSTVASGFRVHEELQWQACRLRTNGCAAGTAASKERESAVQRLSWRGFAVCQNFSNYCRKLINAGARHDDAVPASMSFLSDTQEPTAVVLPELDIEMLALNLQFFRLDDVVHFALRPPSLGSRIFKWKENSAL